MTDKTYKKMTGLQQQWFDKYHEEHGWIRPSYRQEDFIKIFGMMEDAGLSFNQSITLLNTILWSMRDEY